MSSNDQGLRVAAVGTGYFSQFHLEAWTRMPGVTLAGICSRGLENAETAGRNYDTQPFQDFEEMLDAVKPDLVDIITPPVTHLAYITAAAERRIPMICQKPFCQTVDEAELAVQRAAAADTLLVVHENFRFQPWHREIKRVIEQARLGEIYQATFRLRPGDGQGPDAYLARQPYFQQMERFLVHETAIHLIDVFRFLLGEATSVFAQLNRLNPAIVGEDAGIILMNFESGARALFDGNRLSDHAAENRRLTMGEMSIEGSAGTLRLDGDGRLFFRAHGSNDEGEISYAWSNTGFGGDCVYALQEHVVAHLTSGTPVHNTGRDYLANLRAEAAVYDANAQGTKTTL